MKVIYEQNIEIAINSLNEQIKTLEEKKEETISSNATKIQELINKKVNELAEQLKQDAINEICGEELKVFDNEIVKLNYSKQLLTSIISDAQDSEVESEQETTEDNLTENDSTEDVSTDGGN